MVGQKYAQPSVASIVMSLESAIKTETTETITTYVAVIKPDLPDAATPCVYSSCNCN